MSAVDLGHEPRVLGLSPTLGSLLSLESAHPSPTTPPSGSCFLSLSNKIFFFFFLERVQEWGGEGRETDRQRESESSWSKEPEVGLNPTGLRS